MTSFNPPLTPHAAPLPDGLTHTLRTPLGALLAALEVAALPEITAEAQAEAQAIALRQAHRLAELLQALDVYTLDWHGRA